jgi:hypothetical protein
LQLLAVACLSLASKVEEHHAARLSELRLDAYEFDTASILRMELLVLGTLQWRMIAATPFPYISCFAARFRQDERRPIVLRAVECVFAAIKGRPCSFPPPHSPPFQTESNNTEISIGRDELGGVPAIHHRRGIHPRGARQRRDARRQSGRAQGDLGLIMAAIRHRKPSLSPSCHHRAFLSGSSVGGKRHDE